MTWSERETSAILSALANHEPLCCGARGKANRAAMVRGKYKRAALERFTHDALGCGYSALRAEEDGARWERYFERAVDWLSSGDGWNW